MSAPAAILTDQQRVAHFWCTARASTETRVSYSSHMMCPRSLVSRPKREKRLRVGRYYTGRQTRWVVSHARVEFNLVRTAGSR